MSSSTSYRDRTAGSPAAAFGAPPVIGRILREVLYAPACPPAVALLFEVGLTRHNTQHYEAAVNAFLQGLSAWEDYCATTVEAERGIAGLSLEPKPLLPSAPVAGATTSSPSSAASSTSPNAKRKKGNGTADGSTAAAAEEPPAMNIEEELRKQAEEEQTHRLTELLAAKAAIREAAVNMVPLEGRIFVRLAIGGVLESAGHDARALSEYCAALAFAQQLPVAHATLIMATVYSNLGSVYYHLSQYDLAADYFFRALEIRFESVGPQHVDTALLSNNIGAVLITLARANDALVMLYKAREVFEAQLDRAHPRLDIVNRNIGLAKSIVMSEAPPPAPPCRVIFAQKTAPVAPAPKKAGKEPAKGKK